MGQENLPWNLVEGKTRADDPRFWPGGAQLKDETFENALIVDVDITAAELNGATFRNCTLARLDLRDGFMNGATFEDCVFYKCDLRRADLTNATMTNVTIDRSNLCSAKFSEVKATNFRVTRSEASPCDFRHSKLSGFFSYCDLSAVNFDGADVDELVLYRCNIKFSRVSAEKIECTTTGIEAAERAGDHQVPWFLAFATRLDAVPQGDVSDTYFFGRDLTASDFSNRTLKNVNFLRCNLVETNFQNTMFDNCWLWDCEVDQMNMNEAQSKRLTLSYCMGTIQAKGSKFKVLNLTDSELEGSNFEGARIDAGTFSMSQVQNSNFSNMEAFVVESFMTDFINCNFTNTDVSQQASERSYFDEGVHPRPMSDSLLRSKVYASDPVDLYLPPESMTEVAEKQEVEQPETTTSHEKAEQVEEINKAAQPTPEAQSPKQAANTVEYDGFEESAPAPKTDMLNRENIQDAEEAEQKVSAKFDETLSSATPKAEVHAHEKAEVHTHEKAEVHTHEKAAQPTPEMDKEEKKKSAPASPFLPVDGPFAPANDKDEVAPTSHKALNLAPVEEEQEVKEEVLKSSKPAPSPFSGVSTHDEEAEELPVLQPASSHHAKETKPEPKKEEHSPVSVKQTTPEPKAKEATPEPKAKEATHAPKVHVAPKPAPESKSEIDAKPSISAEKPSISAEKPSLSAEKPSPLSSSVTPEVDKVEKKEPETKRASSPLHSLHNTGTPKPSLSSSPKPSLSSNRHSLSRNPAASKSPTSSTGSNASISNPFSSGSSNLSGSPKLSSSSKSSQRPSSLSSANPSISATNSSPSPFSSGSSRLSSSFSSSSTKAPLSGSSDSKPSSSFGSSNEPKSPFGSTLGGNKSPFGSSSSVSKPSFGGGSIDASPLSSNASKPEEKESKAPQSLGSKSPDSPKIDLGISPSGSNPTAAPSSASPSASANSKPAPAAAAQHPSDKAPHSNQTKQPEAKEHNEPTVTSAPSNELVHKEEQLGFFARIIRWFKSLFGG